MELTTKTGYHCNNCGKEITITTTGLLGGVISQLFIKKAMDTVMEEGGVATCDSCSPDGTDHFVPADVVAAGAER